MRLWGLPSPVPWQLSEPLRLVVPHGAYPPQSKGVSASRLVQRRLVTTILEGLPVLQPVESILHASSQLSSIDVLIALEALITTSDVYPGRHPALGAWAPDSVAERIEAWGKGTAAKRARVALTRAKVGVDSPQETRMRATLTGEGLPEPEIQVVVDLGGEAVRLDTAWPEYRVAGEYEGDHHRTDARQWHRDIERERALAAAGWTVIRVTKRDLHARARANLVGTFRNALAKNGARPPE